MSLFQDIETKWVPPASFPRLSGTVAIDLETKDEELRRLGPGWCFPNGGHVAGYALSWEGGQGYWPVGHQGGGNFPKENVVRWLKDEAKNQDITWLMYHQQYDHGWCKREGIEFAGKVIDVATAIPLIDENRFSYRLGDVAVDFLEGQKKQKEEITQALRYHRLIKKNTKGGMEHLWKLPAGYVGPYAEQDAVLTRLLWDAAKQRMDDEKLWDVFNLESNLVPCLMAMRQQGVRVNLPSAERLYRALVLQRDGLLSAIYKHCGKRPDLWASETLGPLLESLNITVPRTPTGKPSIQAGWLEKQEHPVCRLIVLARKTDRAANVFTKSYVLEHAVNGRIHAEFDPLKSDREDGATKGAVSGRFSSSNPNLQNLPARDETILIPWDSDILRAYPEFKEFAGKTAMQLIRGLFLPEEGAQWAAVDFSSQEPRLTVHFASLIKARGVQRFVNAYLENPDLDFHLLGSGFLFGENLAAKMRKWAKNITLGIMYGMGGAKLCRSINLPTKWIEIERQGFKRTIEVAGDEGQAILNRYDNEMPFVKILSTTCQERAKTRNWIRTLLGRVIHFESEKYPNGSYVYKALNRLIQGSAADMLKQAMVDLFHEHKTTPLVTVHDELGLSVDGPEHSKKLKAVMTGSVKLVVPVTADIEIGPTWGDSVKLEEEAA